MKWLRNLWHRYLAWRYTRKYGYHYYVVTRAYRFLPEGKTFLPIIFKRQPTEDQSKPNPNWTTPAPEESDVPF